MAVQTVSAIASSPAPQALYTISSVSSKDGTTIGYRQYGQGRPGIVLVQGGMGFAENYSGLAEALSESYTVYVPDRRGRGMSARPYQSDHSIQRDVEDLAAILTKTDSHYVFALSSGAVIALTAAVTLPTIRKLAVYEPPLYTHRPFPRAELERFNKGMATGNLAAALTAAGKAVGLMPMLNYMPNWLADFLTQKILDGQDQQPNGDGHSMRSLAPTLPYDFRVVEEMHGKLDTWRAIRAEMLLLGGGKSPVYLKEDLQALAKILPTSQRVTFPELGHGASWNYDKQTNPTGNPQAVAQVLNQFFG